MTEIHHKIKAFVKKDFLIRSLVVLALVILIIGEVTVLIQDFYTTHQSGGIKPHEASERRIEPWMTFNYINILFNLPSDYLRDRLAIKDERYPNLEIRRFAKEQVIEQDFLIKLITTAIDQYGER